MTWLPKKKLHQSLRVKERHGIHDPPPTQNNFPTDVTVILDLPQITRNNLLSRQFSFQSRNAKISCEYDV